MGRTAGLIDAEGYLQFYQNIPSGRLRERCLSEAKTERGNRDCQVPAQSSAAKALPEGEPRIMNCFVATHQIAAETSENFLLSCTCGQGEIGV